MSLRPMNVFARDISMTVRICLAFGLLAALAPVSALAANSCEGSANLSPADIVEQAGGARAYPTFCSIPPTPGDVRDAVAFKDLVVDTRLAGRTLARQTSANTFSLAGTDEFSASAREEAQPPPPITTPQSDTAAFVRAARARATPPPRPR